MSQRVVIQHLSDTDMQRLLKAKADDQFQDRDWSDWLLYRIKDITLTEDFHQAIQRSTRENLGKLWMQNFAHNLPDMIRPDALTLSDALPEEIATEPMHDAETNIGTCPRCPHGSAIVVGAGPSIEKFNHVKMLAESNYKGYVLATDRMLIPLLRAGIVPKITLTVDGNREKIVKFYDDPIVDEYGSQLDVLLCSTVAHNVAERLQKAGAKIYWFHATFDDYRNIESFTRLQRWMTSANPNLPDGLPHMSALGNSGATLWVLAHALFRRSPICLIGVDFGYHAGTPIEETQYFKGMLPDAQKMFGPRAVDYLRNNCYREIFNPHTQRYALQDIAFIHYRDGFLHAVTQVKPWIRTIQATGDGALFGPNIEWMAFEDFLKQYPS